MPFSVPVYLSQALTEAIKLCTLINLFFLPYKSFVVLVLNGRQLVYVLCIFGSEQILMGNISRIICKPAGLSLKSEFFSVSFS